MSIRWKSQLFARRITLLVVILLLSGCKVTKHVPPGKYLLKSNTVKIEGDDMDEAAVEKVIRQQPNLRTLWVKWRLVAFNAIDSTKTEEHRIHRLEKFKSKNAKRLAKEDRINKKRRDKAIAHLREHQAKNEERIRQGKKYRPIAASDSAYFYRSIKLKDTLNPRLTWRERVKYKFGEAPVIADSFLFERSQEQLRVYMHKKGYYYDTISGDMDTLEKQRKIKAFYSIVTGPRYYIDSIYVTTDNETVRGNFQKFLKKERDKYDYNPAIYGALYEGKPLHLPYDYDNLSDYRNIIAKFMRDEAMYGFSPSHISYVADTNRRDMTMTLEIQFGDRVIKSPDGNDTLLTIPHVNTKVRNVYFHICDTILWQDHSYTGKITDAKGNVRDTMLYVSFRSFVEDSLGLPLEENGFIQTVDTFYYAELTHKIRLPEDQQMATGEKYYKSRVYRKLFGQPKDSVALNPFRMATFVYNGELFVQPGLLEAQNYLEHTNYYKEYYFDRTYNRLLQLGLFAIIKPEIIETPGRDSIDVHYYLVPAEKQSYSFEPRATNSNGYLGVSASVNYSNRNLFKAGWITTVSLSGGFESQPPVFAPAQDGSQAQVTNRSFNTFEIGPTIKFDLPGFFPVNIKKLPKRSRPRTVLSTAYNYQRRPDFERGVFQMNFLWKLYVGKTQIVSAGIPFVSVIKFVNIDKTPEFEAKIEALNDLFLRSAYSDQLIWEDFKAVFEYDNRDADNKKTDKLRLTFNGTFNTAGNTLSLFKDSQPVDEHGHKKAFGVSYSQFALVDLKFIAYYAFSRKRVLAFRTMGGVGVPYGNTPTSLPYDYSFFAGGANDNRGFLARSLGPGSYKYYMDPNRTATQIGDIRLGASLEFRLGAGLLNSAFFMDVGNVWTYNYDINRPGGQFSKEWYRELGLAVGYGIRVDFEFFIVRADLGIPFTNPALPPGSRWIFQDRDAYYEEIYTLPADEQLKLSAPFQPRLNFGIGFPF
jgi:outer membrane protein insertion porin family